MAVSYDELMNGSGPSTLAAAPTGGYEALVGAAPAPAAPQAGPAPATPLPNVEPMKVDPDSLGSSIGRGAQNLKSNYGATLEAVGDVTGLDAVKAFGESVRKSGKEGADAYGKPTVSSYKQVDDIEDGYHYIKNILGEGAASLGNIAAAGWAAAKVAPGPAKPFAAIGGAFGASFMDNAGNVQNMQHELVDNGQGHAVDSATSLMAGIPMAALDVGAAGVMFKPLVKTLGKDAAEQWLMHSGVKESVVKELAKGALVGGAAGAAEGGIAAAGATMAAYHGADADLDTDTLVENAVNGAIGGGVVGAAGGAVGHGAAAVKHNNLAPDTAYNGSPVADAIADKLGANRTEEPNMLQKAWNGMTQGATANLEPLARMSSKAREFVEAFRPDMTGKTASGPTIFEDQRVLAGEFNSKVDDLIERAGGKKGFEKVLDEYSSGGTSPLAMEFRKVQDDFHKRAIKAGLDVGYINNHLPYSLDVDRIKANKEAFVNEIHQYYPKHTTKAETEQIVDNYIERIERADANAVPIQRMTQDPVTGEWQVPPQYRKDKADGDTMKSKLGQGSKPPENGHLEKHRSFAEVPQAELNKWTVEANPDGKGRADRMVEALHDYYEGGAHRIAFAGRFGPEGEKLNGMIAKINAQVRAQGRTLSHTEASRMYDIVDSYLGLYGNIRNKQVKTAISTANTFTTLKTGALFAFSSLAEMASPAIRGDISSTLQAVMPVAGEMIQSQVRKIYKGLPRSEFSRLAAEANLTLNASTNIAAQRLGSNGLTKWNAKVLRKFFLFNGLSYVTHANTTLAAKAGDLYYQNALKTIASGVPMNSGKGRQAMNQLRSLGVDVKSAAEARALWTPTTRAEIDAAHKTRVFVMQRFARQSVLEPNIGDTPLWENNPHLQLVSTLKKYPTAFSNTLLPALFRKMNPSWAGNMNLAAVGGANALMIGGFMLTVGYVQDALKQMAKGIEEEDDTRSPEQKFADVANATLGHVAVSYISDFIFAPRYGTDGVTAQLGPLAGTVREAGLTGIKFANDPNEGDIWKFLYKQLPVFNVYRPGREWAGEQTPITDM